MRKRVRERCRICPELEFELEGFFSNTLTIQLSIVWN
jgi:hypothetical protein